MCHSWIWNSRIRKPAPPPSETLPVSVATEEPAFSPAVYFNGHIDSQKDAECAWEHDPLSKSSNSPYQEQQQTPQANRLEDTFATPAITFSTQNELGGRPTEAPTVLVDADDDAMSDLSDHEDEINATAPLEQPYLSSTVYLEDGFANVALNPSTQPERVTDKRMKERREKHKAEKDKMRQRSAQSRSAGNPTPIPTASAKSNDGSIEATKEPGLTAANPVDIDGLLSMMNSHTLNCPSNDDVAAPNPLKRMNRAQGHAQIRKWTKTWGLVLRLYRLLIKLRGIQQVWDGLPVSVHYGKGFLRRMACQMQWLVEWAFLPTEGVINDDLLEPRHVRVLGLKGKSWDDLMSMLEEGVRTVPSDERIAMAMKDIRTAEDILHRHADQASANQPSSEKTCYRFTPHGMEPVPSYPLEKLEPRVPKSAATDMASMVTAIDDVMEAQGDNAQRPSRKPLPGEKERIARSSALPYTLDNPLFGLSIPDAHKKIKTWTARMHSNVKHVNRLRAQDGKSNADWDSIWDYMQKVYCDVQSVTGWIAAWASSDEKNPIDREKLPLAELEGLGLKGDGWNLFETMVRKSKIFSEDDLTTMTMFRELFLED